MKSIELPHAFLMHDSSILSICLRDEKVMKYLVNSREMKQYDTNTTEHFKVPSLLLMERAALAVLMKSKAVPMQQKFLIVCGTGNNGADGFALTRLLLLDGAEVHTVLIGDRKKETDQCKSSWRSFCLWMSGIGSHSGEHRI